MQVSSATTKNVVANEYVVEFTLPAEEINLCVPGRDRSEASYFENRDNIRSKSSLCATKLLFGRS